MPFTRERWQSSRWPAPNAWATSVSRPIRRPPPKNATTLKLLELMLTAPMAPALSGKCPTITVSTMPIVIQPISARTSGSARRRVGRISARSVCRRSMALCGEPWKCKRGKENEQMAVVRAEVAPGKWRVTSGDLGDWGYTRVCVATRLDAAPILAGEEERGMANFLEYNPEQAYLLPPTVREVLGEGHLCFFVHGAVEKLNLQEFEAGYSDEGHPAIIQRCC